MKEERQKAKRISSQVSAKERLTFKTRREKLGAFLLKEGKRGGREKHTGSRSGKHTSTNTIQIFQYGLGRKQWGQCAFGKGGVMGGGILGAWVPREKEGRKPWPRWKPPCPIWGAEGVMRLNISLGRRGGAWNDH